MIIRSKHYAENYETNRMAIHAASSEVMLYGSTLLEEKSVQIIRLYVQ
jgi:hypothetical protein